MGECTKENAFELLDTFYDLGGNFIDTANQYQGGQSEEWIGEWVEKTGRRNELVISTKYTLASIRESLYSRATSAVQERKACA